MDTRLRRSLLLPPLLAGLLLAAIGGAALAAPAPACPREGCPGDGGGNGPTISVDTPSMTYNEGSGTITVTNSGTYSSEDVASLSASFGSIQQDSPSGGRWTWSAQLNADDGPLTQSVTVGVADGFGADSATFTIKVTNLAPTANLWVQPVVAPNSPLRVTFLNQADPSAADRAAGFTYKVKCDDYFADWDWTYDGFSRAADSYCSTYGANPQHIIARIYDKNGGFSEYDGWSQHDAVAPSLSVGAPLDGSSVRGVVPLGVAVSDNMGMDFVRVNLGANGENGYIELHGPSWSGAWTSTGYPDGPFTLKVVAYDIAGNRTTQNVNVTIDNTPPDTGITAGPADAMPSAGASFAFASSEGGTAFEYALDGGAWTACACTSAGVTNLADGQHTFSVRAYDPAGNVDPSPATRTWTVETVPAAPTNLTRGAVTGTSVALAWTDHALTETGFLVQRRTGASGAWSTVALPQPAAAADSGATVSFTDTTLQPGTANNYRVRATNGAAASAWVYTDGPALTPIDAPATFTRGAVARTSVAMAWSAVPGASGYRIMRKAGATAGFGTVKEIAAPATSWTDEGVAPGIAYTYVIRASNDVGGSVVLSSYTYLSNVATTPLDAPAGLATASVSATRVALGWTDTCCEHGYQFERRDGPSGAYRVLSATIGAGATAYTDATAQAGRTYYYRLRARRTTNGTAVYSEYAYLTVKTPAQ